VFNVIQAKSTQTEVVTVPREHSLMEINVKPKISQVALVFQILIGMELVVFVSLDLLEMEPHAIVMVLLLDLIVKDVLPSLIHFLLMEFVNVILDM
jgi:hypothetical protein